jgi:hypothetical protein
MAVIIGPVIVSIGSDLNKGIGMAGCDQGWHAATTRTGTKCFKDILTSPMENLRREGRTCVDILGRKFGRNLSTSRDANLISHADMSHSKECPLQLFRALTARELRVVMSFPLRNLASVRSVRH